MVLVGATGCEELSARRMLQEADKLYETGQLEKATTLCDKALETLGGFDIALHNCALIYLKYFKPGIDTPENLAAANRTTELLGRYLKVHPEEGKLVDIMTQVWIDSGQHDKALQYWEANHAKDPGNTEVIGRVATILRMAGRWQDALAWHEKEFEVEKTPHGKVRALKNIGNLVASKLLYERASIKWQERLATADIGIYAMQRAEAIMPDDYEVEQLLGNLFGSRGESHQPAWAQLFDTAYSRYHYKKFSALKLALEGKKPSDESDDSNKPETDAGVDGGADQGADDKSGDGATKTSATTPGP